MIKYSKSYSNIFKIKEDYIIKNNQELENVIKINRFYKKQKLSEKIYLKNTSISLDNLLFLFMTLL